jgi:predicted GNAT family acetyltransferase
MSEIRISKEDLDARHGRYVARIEGVNGEAELVFTRRGPDKISADHTGAPVAMRGTGAAPALVLHMVQDARQNGFRIIPICPYVKGQFARHPEWADVFVTAD